jgi:hypothetical protein
MEDLFTEDSQDLKEVEKRKENPKIVFFVFLSLE